MKEDSVDIVLVEDNLSDAELTIRALSKKKLANNLIHLSDGSQALDFLFGEGKYFNRDNMQLPKVILLDLKMPKINGIEVLTRLRTDERTCKIPVVVLTSSQEDSDVNQCYRLGINSYIVKPVEFDKFLQAVSEVAMYWLALNCPPQY
jgi:two-component system, response regulator